MCLGIPGQVVELRSDHPDLARVDVEGVIRDVNLGLLADDPALPGTGSSSTSGSLSRR